MRTVITVILILAFAVFAFGQSAAPDKFKPSVKFGFGSQLITAYQKTTDGEESVGTGSRLIVALASAKLTEHLTGNVVYAWNLNKMLDAFVTYTFNQHAAIRVGRFKGAGMKAGPLTSPFATDFFNHTVTAKKMAIATSGGDFRHIGIEFSGKYNIVGYRFYLHNKDGAENLSPTIYGDNPTGNNGLDFKNYDAMLYATPVKGLEFGGHYGAKEVDLNSYSAYLYYKYNAFRTKIDFGGFNTLEVAEKVDQQGFSILGAYKITPAIEALVRYETFDNNTDVDDTERNYITIGATYSFTPKKYNCSKLTLAYVKQGETGVEVDNDIFYLSYQILAK